MMQPIAIAMSGGVDSTMAAYLIKKQGLSVVGLHFITGYEDDFPFKQGNRDTGQKPDKELDRLIETARKRMTPISEHLGIPLEIYDIHTEFETSVISYFAKTYTAGQTPNPCMVCNPTIKFGTLLKVAQKLGAGHLVTGHYANVVEDQDGIFHLLRGKDPQKEQSYFLARLSQKQLASANFPLAEMTKPEVKELAEANGIAPFIKQESQDICFIKNRTYSEFLTERFGLSPKPGPIVDLKGNHIGNHKGLNQFTIGQRRGINCPAAEPYYVVRLDMDRNRLMVGHKQDLLTSECKVKDINWIIESPKSPVSFKTRIRYRHQGAASTLLPINEKDAIVRFEHPQEAITPGQCAVFYQGNEVMGGGWIQPIEENADI